MLTGGNKILVAEKKALNKVHTQTGFAPNEEEISTNVSISYSTVFAQTIPNLPISFNSLSSAYDTNGVVEYIRFEVEKIEDTEVGPNQSQGWRLKLPATYSASGYNQTYSSGDYLSDSVGKLQLVPPIYGTMDINGDTDYTARMYKVDGTADVIGSGTEIDKFDPINWYIDYYSGVIFVQDPSTNFDLLDFPKYVDAFLYVGNYLDEAGQMGVGLKSGLSSHTYTKLTSSEFAITTGTTMDSSIAFSSINAKNNDIVIDLADITGSTTNWVVKLPSLLNQSNQEGKRVNVIVKDFNPSGTNYNLYIKTPWSSSGTTNRLLSVNMDTIVTDEGHYIRLEPLESISLLYDGADWIVTAQNKMSFIDFQATDPINNPNTDYLSR